MSLDTDRRAVIAGALGLGLMPGAAVARAASPAFLWGVATAAHQVEGGNVNSDVWLLEQLSGTPFVDKSGDAIDHYHRFEDDIALIARLGFSSYRFSIEWARVEPAEGQFSDAEMAHYARMLDCCRRHGLTPVVTLHHFTSPRWFAASGGFENQNAPAVFARYAARVVAALGDRIGWLCTINEANLSFAPSPRLRTSAATATGSTHFSTFLFSDTSVSKPIVRACHAAARTAIKAIRPALPVGYTLAMDDVQDSPDAPGRGTAMRSAMYDVWLEAARQDDFVGVQTYTRLVVGPKGPVRLSPETPRTQLGQEVYPAALGGTVRYAAKVSGRPILVTENGVGTEDDALRIRYIDGALAALGACRRDGIDVRGYVHWSAFDNFEWLMGYRPKFGLVAVDRATQTRTPKPSARHLGAIARARRSGPWGSQDL
ncbi:family 1 glycosylhydrolase [Sphingomonas sp. RP10(2022)]|uniref:Family 1 glycosylhydrolase n=1 Tax=Sphingomonas liriopis TaxID=2949094 RepID=A0A9X2I139_9SPHN|nr:family 1 glycosylhydrolase [Sphingomonas liriopis]MCP3735915.1 family 1 glycosylhydrolase [Sphingomonas liriopis]